MWRTMASVRILARRRGVVPCVRRRRQFALSATLRAHDPTANLERPAAARMSWRPSYWHEPSGQPLSPLTVGRLLEAAAERWPEREALVSMHEGRRMTFAYVLEEVDKLAAVFREIGLEKGDKLGLCGPNSCEWYLTNLAAARAGLVLVNINPAYQIPEIEYCISKVGIKALVIPETFKTQKYYEIIRSIAPEMSSCQPGNLESKRVPTLKSVIVISRNKLPCTYTFHDLVESATPSSVQAIQQLQSSIQPDDGCNLQFTSGTTGQPKGTLLSHHNIVNNGYLAGKRLGYDSKHHRICLQVPLFHCFGNVLGVVFALHFGSTLVLPAFSFQPLESIAAIQKERCSVIYGTPTMYVDLISKSEQNACKFDSLDFAITAGAFTSPSLFHKILQTFSLSKCYSLYGMTETSPLSFVPMADDSHDRCANTVGKVLDHLEVKVVDTDGEMVPMGTPGELLVRGYGNMLLYYEDHDRTKAILGHDRWLRTGDQFVLHEDGYGQVVGRIKEMIIRGGENIFPKEIENFLITHPAVLEAQVIGVPDERFGEEMCACVRVRPGHAVTPDELRSFCKGQIAHFKIPRYIEIFDEFPKTLSGKVQKFKLQEMMTNNKRTC